MGLSDEIKISVDSGERRDKDAWFSVVGFYLLVVELYYIDILS